jgi:hypothetical protein
MKEGDIVVVQGYKGIFEIVNIKFGRWVYEGGEWSIKYTENVENYRLFELKQIATASGRAYKSTRTWAYREENIKSATDFIEKKIMTYQKYIEFLTKLI